VAEIWVWLLVEGLETSLLLTRDCASVKLNPRAQRVLGRGKGNELAYKYSVEKLGIWLYAVFGVSSVHYD